MVLYVWSGIGDIVVHTGVEPLSVLMDSVSKEQGTNCKSSTFASMLVDDLVDMWGYLQCTWHSSA